MLDLNIYLARVNDSGEVVMVHHNCRRKFTDAWSKTTKNEVPKKKLRSSLESTSFQWKEDCDCFLCSEKIDDHNLKREGVSSVMTLPTRDKLIKEQMKDLMNGEKGFYKSFSVAMTLSLKKLFIIMRE